MFLAELGPDSRLAQAARFAAKTLTGLPSILAGVFAYAVVVLTDRHLFRAGRRVALAVLMLPTVVLTAEEAIKMVPEDHAGRRLRHGLHPQQVDLEGAAADRDARHPDRRHAGGGAGRGETAPLLFTALFSNYWLFEDGELELMQPTASLAVLIYNFSGMPFDNQIELAWAASLVLVLIVLVINIISRLVGQRRV